MADKNAFLGQIDRLRNQFGVRAYGNEKIELIWQEVRNISDANLKNIIDDFIADAKFSPTRKDFMMAIGEKRIQVYEKEKKNYADEARKLTPENYKSGMKVLGGILNGQYSPEQINSWVKQSKEKQLACKKCNGSGFVWAKEKDSFYDNYCFKCICPIGKEMKEAYPTWSGAFAEKYEIME